MPSFRSLLAPLLLLAGCSLPPCFAPPAPQLAQGAGERQQEPGLRYQAGGGEWGERVPVDLQVFPAAWIEIDSPDPVVAGQSTGTATGYGYGARVAFGNRDQSIGVLYQGFELDADNTDVRLHTAYLDFDVRIPLEEGGGAFWFVAGAGLGGAWIDFDSGAAATVTEGASHLRVGLNIEPSRTFAVNFGIGGLLIGHPGSTEAYGTFLMLGGALTF